MSLIFRRFNSVELADAQMIEVSGLQSRGPLTNLFQRILSRSFVFGWRGVHQKFDLEHYYPKLWTTRVFFGELL